MIDLNGKWVSTFIQNNRIYNEIVNFKQNNNKVKARILLNYEGVKYNYNFTGIINDKLINGVYENKDNLDFESGTITLKIINEDFLYGVTTYISDNKDNDDVVQSPYALFRNHKNNLGTFDMCADCVNASATCCSNPQVDSPMILPNEVKEIANNVKKAVNEFATAIDFSKMHHDNTLKQLYQMKKQEDSNNCYFYQNNKCTIYDIRPIDCRIFPYDIKLEADGCYYLVYYTTNKCAIKSFSTDNLKMISYNTRLYLRLLLPYIREWTDPYCSKKLTSNENYKVICKIEDFF